MVHIQNYKLRTGQVIKSHFHNIDQHFIENLSELI